MELSIITINRNNANGLEKTIRSVMSQTYQGFEYIVVDGASNDGSVEVLQRLLGADAGVSSDCVEVKYKDRCHSAKWISEHDNGIYNAMNKGIKKSHGDYLLFLNSGDFLVGQDVIERVFCCKPSEDLLCARCNVSENGQVVWTSDIVPQTITLYWLYFKGIMHQSTFIKRDLFESIGLYDESFKWLADYQFWYKALIYNDAVVRPVDVVVSDFNKEGLSSCLSDNKEFIAEKDWARSQPVLKHVIPDYDRWKNEKRIVEEYAWIEDVAFLKEAIRFFRKIHRRLGGIKRRR